MEEAELKQKAEKRKCQAIQNKLIEKLVLVNAFQNYEIKPLPWLKLIRKSEAHGYGIAIDPEAWKTCYDDTNSYDGESCEVENTIEIGDLEGIIKTKWTDTSIQCIRSHFKINGYPIFRAYSLEHSCDLGDVFSGKLRNAIGWTYREEGYLQIPKIEILRYVPGEWEEQLDVGIKSIEKQIDGFRQEEEIILKKTVEDTDKQTREYFRRKFGV